MPSPPNNNTVAPGLDYRRTSLEYIADDMRAHVSAMFANRFNNDRVNMIVVYSVLCAIAAGGGALLFIAVYAGAGGSGGVPRAHLQREAPITYITRSASESRECEAARRFSLRFADAEHAQRYDAPAKYVIADTLAKQCMDTQVDDTPDFTQLLVPPTPHAAKMDTEAMRDLFAAGAAAASHNGVLDAAVVNGTLRLMRPPPMRDTALVRGIAIVAERLRRTKQSPLSPIERAAAHRLHSLNTHHSGVDRDDNTHHSGVDRDDNNPTHKAYSGGKNVFSTCTADVRSIALGFAYARGKWMAMLGRPMHSEIMRDVVCDNVWVDAVAAIAAEHGADVLVRVVDIFFTAQAAELTPGPDTEHANLNGVVVDDRHALHGAYAMEIGRRQCRTKLCKYVGCARYAETVVRGAARDIVLESPSTLYTLDAALRANAI